MAAVHHVGSSVGNSGAGGFRDVLGSSRGPRKTAEVESRNAERVRLRAERDKLSSTNPEGLADAWAMIEDIWTGTVARARELPERVLHEQVEGEWSFVQTHVTS